MKFSKLMALVLGLLITVTAVAGDNSIYISQTGSNATVSVNQDGAGNILQGLPGAGNGSTNPAIINGDNNNVTINQVGTGNTLSMGIATTTANGVSNGNNYTYSLTGNNGNAIIDSNGDGTGQSESNNLSATLTGNYSGLKFFMLGSQNSSTITTAGGSYNSVISTINGSNITQNIDISGGGNNSVVVNQGIGGSAIGLTAVNLSGTTSATTDNNGSASITIVGASNEVTLDQEGGTGSGGHTFVISLTGSSNIANITQLGTSFNSTINLHSTGNGNTFTISSNTH